MKTIQVSAAVIQKDNKIFATQRGYGAFKGFWEFPGGKLELDETPEESLHREIMEELDLDIAIGDLLDIVEYDYPEFHIKMYCFLCAVKSGSLTLKEHDAARWLTKEALWSVDWLPADQSLIQRIEQLL